MGFYTVIMSRKVLIVHAHPEPNSFCSALMQQVADSFENQGDQVRVSDLYALNFQPVGGKNDFTQLSNETYFKYQLEQLHATENKSFETSLQHEMDALLWCDTLVFSFPLWWFGLPAILKGWVDRVFAMGLVYGGGKGVYDNGIFFDKTAFLVLTTGGPEIAYGDQGKNGNLEQILFPIHHGMLYFVGMTVLPPFISFSPARSSQEERALELVRLKQFVQNLDHQTPIYTNKN